MPRSPWITTAIPLLLLTTSATAQVSESRVGSSQPGELTTFGDWTIGCDNLLSCTAVGMGPDLTFSGYVVVRRAAGAGEDATVSLTAIVDAEEEPYRLRLSLGGGGAQALPVNEIEAEASGNVAIATFDGEDARELLAGLLPADTLDIAHADGTGETSTVSLNGMSAALRYMDDVQGRDGGGSALVAVGSREAGEVPPPPPLPEPVRAVALREIEPAPELPEAIPDTSGDCSEWATPVAYETGTGERIFGVCYSTGAYNAAYEYWLAGDGAPRKLSFEIPGGEMTEGFDGLVNPGLDPETRILSEFNKARGIGDCGGASEWAFDGDTFRLVSLAVMGECRGVQFGDWPVLFRSETVAAD